MELMNIRKKPARHSVAARFVGLGVVASLMLLGLWSYGPRGAAEAAGGKSGTVRTHIKDNGKSCIEPNGPYSNVWVTVTGVKAHLAGGGWTTLVPSLSPSNPMQVDLLAESSNECFLATLGVTTGLQAGKYNQIRIYLEPNKATSVTLQNGESNACESVGGWNCVVDTNGTHTLQLTSEAQTGLKIPASQIAHGGISLSAGQGADIDLDFNACRSIVVAGNARSHHGAGPKFILKPVLHANEIGTSALVAGTVFEGTESSGSVIVPTSNPTVVPFAEVWLEQQSSAFTVGNPGPTASPTPGPVENVIAMMQADANGQFEFCPANDGSYEVVTDSADLPTSKLPSNATITENVQVAGGIGANNLAIPLLAELPPGGAPVWALIEGMVTSQNSSLAPTPAAATLWALQPFTNGTGDVVQALVPPFTGTNGTQPTPVPPQITTGPGPATSSNCPNLGPLTCPANTDCECFTLAVPASNPVVGSQADGYAAPASAPANYGVGAVASTCTPSMLQTDPTSPLAVTGGTFTLAPNPTLSFAGCL
jgi:Domain of unknown function (DUF4382)